jgi:hypothetical protein
MVHSPVEKRVVEKSLIEVDGAIQPNEESWKEEQIEKLTNRPWEILVNRSATRRFVNAPLRRVQNCIKDIIY